MTTPGWGKVKNGAQYAGMCKRSFRDLLKMGLAHSRLPSGTILIKYSDIDEFLKRYEVNSNEVDALADEVLKDF